MTDFGADESFGKAAKKIKEHYGIEISLGSTQRITKKHAEIISLEEESRHEQNLKAISNSKIDNTIISEIDGSMVPIVEFSIPLEKTENDVDLRKCRTLVYKEARLALAHQKNSETTIYAATMGDVQQAGRKLRICAEEVGLDEETKVHGISDGALWIASQFNRQFGDKATYLVDFYHLCEYLEEAAKSISNSKIWIEKQKTFLKNSQATQVLLELEPYLEAKDIPDNNAPVRACYRYINNRNGQFLYKEAIEHELPIGSGEVESEHRYISQKRLKIPGAWWKIDNAENMLSLRVLRANNHWENYWKETRLKLVA